MKAFFSKICGRRKKNRAATALQNLSGKDAKKGDEAAPAELPGEAAGQRDEAAIQEFYRKEAEENKTKVCLSNFLT